MKFSARLDGDLTGILARDLDRMERAHTRAVSRVGADVKQAWRADIQGAGLGNRLANTVRLAVYPSGETSINPAAQIWTKAPKIVAAHDEGTLIRSKDGFWLAIPLEAAGRGRFGRRITPGEYEKRTGQRLRFVYRSARSSLLVADDARLSKRGQARRKGGRRRKDGILSGAQTIPVFALVPQVKLPKRTALTQEAERVVARLPDLMAEWI
ncbi:DUF6441 family protein [Citreimonas sp.]|uniref:DUF6441 family protein n=1 Tax=Citreimonas sp. TaxID=3036715 RepID=UPI0040596905